MQLEDRAGSPEEWLRYAGSDLALAAADPPPGVMRETLCFHAQQGAKKAVKAVLVAYETAFPYTHNIAVLLDLLPADMAVPPEVRGGARLTEYASVPRYPGRAEPVTEEERLEAVQLARAVVVWAQEAVAAAAQGAPPRQAGGNPPDS